MSAGLDDMQLLRRYAETGCQEAFSRLVSRHINWVYTMCLRGVKDRHLAEDVTQAVFLILARKAASIPDQTLLTGWLFKTSRFAAADARKRRSRYKRHTERAAELAPQPAITEQEETWERLTPILDEAVAWLPDNDRQVVLLRFYEAKSLKEVALAMGCTEEAAKKRLQRAVEKLRGYFGRQGIVLPLSLLLTLMLTRTSEAAAPALGATCASVATGHAMASASSLFIAEAAVKGMLEATSRLLAALVSTTLVSVMGLTVYLVGFSGDDADPDAPARIIVDSQPSAAQALVIDWERFAQVWVGNRDRILWHTRPGALPSPDLPPVPIDDGTSLRGAYAVAVDHEGGVWLKRLADDLLSSPLLDNWGDEPDPDSRAAALLSAVLADEPVLVSSGGALGGGGGGAGADGGLGGSLSTPPFIEREFPSDRRWRFMPGAIRDGAIVVEEIVIPDVQLYQFDMDRLLPTITIPEPASAALLAALAALCMRPPRRRRRA